MPLTAGSLVVEDGTGLANANTYLTLEDADAYHDGHGNTAWAAATEADRVKALVGATQYIDVRWQFQGDIENADDPQSLAWPRTGEDSELLDARGFNVSGSVPQQIADACAEYALIALSGPLLPELTVPDDAGRFVTMKHERVGPIQEETRFSSSVPIQTKRKYPLPDLIIRRSGLVAPSLGNMEVR